MNSQVDIGDGNATTRYPLAVLDVVGHEIAHGSFCLLAKRPNWNTRKAFGVFALANRTRWSITTQFNDGACGVELAATDLGYSKADVTAAFESVGVYCFSWNENTATPLYGGPAPILTNSITTIENGGEPPNGIVGFASLATIAKSSGKRHLEFSITRLTYTNVYDASGNVYLMLADPGINLHNVGHGEWGVLFAIWNNQPPNQNQGYAQGYRMSGSWCRPCADRLSSWRGQIRAGDVIGVAADLTTGKIWYSLNGVWVGDPAAGTGAVFDQSEYTGQQLAGRTVVPRIYAEFQQIEVTVRGSAGQFRHPIPAGFAPWTN